MAFSTTFSSTHHDSEFLFIFLPDRMTKLMKSISFDRVTDKISFFCRRKMRARWMPQENFDSVTCFNNNSFSLFVFDLAVHTTESTSYPVTLDSIWSTSNKWLLLLLLRTRASSRANIERWFRSTREIFFSYFCSFFLFLLLLARVDLQRACPTKEEDDDDDLRNQSVEKRRRVCINESGLNKKIFFFCWQTDTSTTCNYHSQEED